MISWEIACLHGTRHQVNSGFIEVDINCDQIRRPITSTQVYFGVSQPS